MGFSGGSRGFSGGSRGFSGGSRGFSGGSRGFSGAGVGFSGGCRVRNRQDTLLLLGSLRCWLHTSNLFIGGSLFLAGASLR